MRARIKNIIGWAAIGLIVGGTPLSACTQHQQGQSSSVRGKTGRYSVGIK
jgi:hypothetical protein